MIILPTVEVPVFSPQRTFWEKATLIHVECSKVPKYERRSVDRLSRHWYDLTMLYKNQIGQAALANKALLNEVVKHKKIFFPGSDYNYDNCLQGQFKLLPGDEYLKVLKQDFQNMINTGMFYQTPPDFEEILDTLHELENRININD